MYSQLDDSLPCQEDWLRRRRRRPTHSFAFPTSTVTHAPAFASNAPRSTQQTREQARSPVRLTSLLRPVTDIDPAHGSPTKLTRTDSQNGGGEYKTSGYFKFESSLSLPVSRQRSRDWTPQSCRSDSRYGKRRVRLANARCSRRRTFSVALQDDSTHRLGAASHWQDAAAGNRGRHESAGLPGPGVLLDPSKLALSSSAHAALR